MGSISERERILLGYAPRDASGGDIARSQSRNSEVDFLDVFGGPPRRSLVYESLPSQGDSFDSYSRQNRVREDSMGSHRSRLGSWEKPVFDGGSSGRRQQLGDDFYGDIFRSRESSCSSPRKGDRDPLMSSPSSRINSPNRPTPPWLEPLFEGSSLPTQPSLSETVGKGSDHQSFGSPTNRSVYKSYDDLKNDGSYRRSPLSHQIPLGFEDLSETKEPAFQSIESQTGKSSCSLEDYINNRQFHFSIYRWAGKGVMLVMPSDSNEGNELEGLTRFPEIIVQELELPTHCDYISPVIKSSKSETVIQENKSDKKEDDYAGTTAKISHAKFGLELFKDKYGHQSEEDSVSSFDRNSTNNTDGKQNPEQNPELKSFSQLFDDDIEKQRSHEILRQVKGREAQSKSQKKQLLRKESKLHGEDNSTTLHDIPSFSEDKPLGSKVKGKVKEFIKKFNQESPSKRKGAFEKVKRSSKFEGTTQDNVDKLAHDSSIEPDKLQEGSGNKSIPLFDIPKVMENQLIEKAEEGMSSFSYSGHIIDDRPLEERVEALHSQAEPTPEGLNNAACYEEIFHEDIDEYRVQQLPINLSEEALNGSQQEQIKDLDANIRQWSKGKEGNIRSLLSTLQFVLWPESGWKQVPLVNIVEGSSVKKAYQKALLCLHPDKLQQKGASSNQKYIAEKVFDILQEAWDHFNSVSQL